MGFVFTLSRNSKDNDSSQFCDEDYGPALHTGDYTASYTNAVSYRMGELEPWIDENFVRSVWFGMGEQVNVKMIRDKFSG
jgi:hypothetical protein